MLDKGPRGGTSFALDLGSNLGKGMPIDLLVARPDLCDTEVFIGWSRGVPYFHGLREHWSEADQPPRRLSATSLLSKRGLI